MGVSREKCSMSPSNVLSLAVGQDVRHKALHDLHLVMIVRINDMT